MNQIDTKVLAAAFAKRLAAHKFSSEAVETLASQVSKAGTKPIDIDICQYGICVDYLVPRKSLGELINRLEQDFSLGGVRIFPKGIIDPDAFLVKVEHAFER